MFIIYGPEGRNFIGTHPGKTRDATKINPLQKTTFQETMLELEPDPPESSPRHYQTHRALHQYQKQLDAIKERHIIVVVSEIMSTEIITVTPETTFHTAWELMQNHKIHHLPVVQDGNLVGMCSSQELLRHVIVNKNNQLEPSIEHQISEIANPEVITTIATVDVRRVAFIMTEYQIGALPVMSDTGQLIGIITRSDLIKRLAKLPPLEIYA